MDNKNFNIAIYPGSFDPITLGHLDILKIGASMFDKVIIAVADNKNKNCMFSVDERKKLIEECTKNLPNVETDSFDGLTVEYAREKGAKFLLRGLRSILDFEYEKELAQNNRLLAHEIETVFLITKPEYSSVSSSAVKEILKHHGDISEFVSKDVIKIIGSKCQQ